MGFNDRWEAIKGLRKKYDAGQDIGLELLIGAELLNAAAAELKADRAALTAAAEQLSRVSPEQGVSIAQHHPG